MYRFGYEVVSNSGTRWVPLFGEKGTEGLVRIPPSVPEGALDSLSFEGEIVSIRNGGDDRPPIVAVKSVSKIGDKIPDLGTLFGFTPEQKGDGE